MFSAMNLKENSIKDRLPGENLASFFRLSTLQFKPDYKELLKIQLHSLHQYLYCKNCVL